MTSPLKEIQFPNRLESLESEAKQHLAESANQWRLFVAKVSDIFKSKLWHEKTKDWNVYCKSEFGITAATIRQKAAQVPYAELIEASTGHNLTVSKIKALREIVEDKSIAVEYVYEVAARNTPDGKIPTNTTLQISYNRIKEAQTGRIELGDAVYEVTPVTLDASITQDIVDATQRQRDYIAGNSKPKQKLTTVIQGEMVNGRLRAVLGEDIPAFLIGKTVTFYIGEDES